MADIDFDAASNEWRQNKTYLGKGMFAYRCNYIHSNGKSCNKIVAAQVYKYQYRIREDWISEKNSTFEVRQGLTDSLTAKQTQQEFCKTHLIRGPAQKYK